MDKLMDDIWDSEEKKFNKYNMQILLDHLTGKHNATVDDVEALFSGNPIYTNATTKEASREGDPNGTYHQEYSSKVVKSDLLNRNANKITQGIGDNNVEKGLCVTLKGKKFRVTSLTRTLPTTENPDGDIVTTLLLKEPEGEVRWNLMTIKSSNSSKSQNIYGTSDIRQALIGTSGWLESFVGTDSNFSKFYLIKPSYIGYQLEQSVVKCWKKFWKFSLPNEAIGDVGGFCESSDYYNSGDEEKRAKYISWGEDYVWLPSLSEIGSLARELSIWGMSNEHRCYKGTHQLGLQCIENRYAWLRSGDATNYKNAHRLNSLGAGSGDRVDNSRNLRPAIHLNLSFANKPCNMVAKSVACKPDQKKSVDLWNNEKKVFDKDCLQILLNHITGRQNATMDDIESLFTGAPIYTNATTKVASGDGDPNGTYHQEYSSKVVKSDLLNRNANKITPGIGDNDKSKGLCVTLKGKEFRVTSLTRTLPTANKPNGDIVATLLLKEPEGKVQWNSICDQDSLSLEQLNMYYRDRDSLSLEPFNMYGTSDIRQIIISANGWLNEFVYKDNDFAKTYLVQPNHIGYQQEQSVVQRWKEEELFFNLTNEALGNVKHYEKGKDEAGYFQNYDYYNNGDKKKRAKYISWGSDYVWLPSLSEIGIEEGCQSIWGLSICHRGWHDNSENESVWLRTGGWSYCDAYFLESSCAYDGDFCDSSRGLRPAFHLNLSAIKSSFE